MFWCGNKVLREHAAAQPPPRALSKINIKVASRQLKTNQLFLRYVPAGESFANSVPRLWPPQPRPDQQRCVDAELFVSRDSPDELRCDYDHERDDDEQHRRLQPEVIGETAFARDMSRHCWITSLRPLAGGGRMIRPTQPGAT
jgi:hypothetical protein